jgi:hypothetical protein
MLSCRRTRHLQCGALAATVERFGDRIEALPYALRAAKSGLTPGMFSTQDIL